MESVWSVILWCSAVGMVLLTVYNRFVGRIIHNLKSDNMDLVTNQILERDKAVLDAIVSERHRMVEDGEFTIRNEHGILERYAVVKVWGNAQ